jgi:2-hydroxy-6-oxonona-2,4-dienedioate hydrolase
MSGTVTGDEIRSFALRRRHPLAVGKGPLQSRWTVVDGRRMHMRVSTDPVPPDRVPVVLVHGMVVSSLYMVPTAERLAPEFRTFAPDLPGFGHSESPPYVLNVLHLADTLADWMEAVGLERAALVGNSLGCQIVADLAVRYPERVERAVLVGPTVDPRNRRTFQQVTRLLLDGQMEKAGLMLVHLRDYWKAGVRRAYRTYQYMMEDRIEEKLPRVRVPTLVVRGGKDPVVPQRWVEEAIRLLPSGKLRVIPGAAHAVNYDAPLELVRVMRPFLLEGARSTQGGSQPAQSSTNRT